MTNWQVTEGKTTFGGVFDLRLRKPESKRAYFAFGRDASVNLKSEVSKNWRVRYNYNVYRETTDEFYGSFDLLGELKDYQVRLGLFYVPFGLKDLDRDDKYIGERNIFFDNYALGVMFEKSQAVRIAAVGNLNGCSEQEEAGTRNFFIQLSEIFGRKVPIGFSFLRGEKKIYALGADTIINLPHSTNLKVEYLSGFVKCKYEALFLAGEQEMELYPLKIFIKYGTYKENTTQSYAYKLGAEYELLEEATFQIRYEINRGAGVRNALVAKLKVMF